MKNRNHFQTLPAGALKLKGELGKMQLLCIENLVKRTNWAGLVVPFRERYETNSWRGEFWGKMIRGAILLAYTTQDAELKKLIKETVYDIISTQDENGCITAVAEKNQSFPWELPIKKLEKSTKRPARPVGGMGAQVCPHGADKILPVH